MSSAKVEFSSEGYQKKAAFTLAEVLITLAIIGIIAAMTLPTLMTKISKHILAKKLEQTYAILVQARRMANADHGSMYGGSYWEHVGESTQMKMYESDLFPFLKIILKKKCSLKDLGYNSPIYYAGGEKVLQSIDAVSTRVVLANGVIFIAFFDCKVSSGGKNYYLGSYILVDLNGTTGPNTIGRDIFSYYFDFATDTSFAQDLFIENAVSFSEAGEVISSHRYTHQELINRCKSTWTAAPCGALIKQNHWEFPDDYPLW